MDDEAPDAAVVEAIGPRLRTLRVRRGMTLAELSAASGIAASSLSRLEAGRRRPSLEQVLALARVHQVSLDELTGAPTTGDPRVNLRARNWNGRTVIPLTRSAGAPQAFKMVIPGAAARTRPELHGHEGYEWLYVLNGRLRLVLGGESIDMVTGEAAEFDTRIPHWFGAAGPEPVEILALLGTQGERAHLRTTTPTSGEARTGA